jgi:transcriptional regulator of acetoin/glycerol metabolism
MIPILLSASPIRDNQGNLVGASKVARDRSEVGVWLAAST